MLPDLIGAHKGAFVGHTELRAQTNSSQHVTFMAGNMTVNNRVSVGGVSARVYRGGTFGFASGAAYTPEGVRDVLAAASRNAAFMDAHVKKGEPALPSLAPGNVGLKNGVSGPVPQATLVDFARALDGIVAGKYKNLSSRTVSINCMETEKLLVVSDGSDGRSFQPRALVYVNMTAETPDGTPVELMERFCGNETFDACFTDPELFVPKLDALYENLMDKREGAHARAGLCKCVLHPDLAGMLAHEAVGHTVEADIVLGGSVAANRVGSPVASGLVSMTDFAHTAFGGPCPLPVYVDDEGTPARDARLIENGVLVGFMHSRDTARRFGAEPAGNARAFYFSDEPLIRMRNTAIHPGPDRLDDMIASVDDGYFLVKTGNGQADTTGEFMFSVGLAYEIKKGRLGRAIRETTISGVAFEMLKTVDMVSDDMAWDFSGFCGKKQYMPVGMGGPALRCDMNIGGR